MSSWSLVIVAGGALLVLQALDAKMWLRERYTCWRRGHDPRVVGNRRVCWRCARRLPL